jgi:hypothetical protein
MKSKNISETQRMYQYLNEFDFDNIYVAESMYIKITDTMY